MTARPSSLLRRLRDLEAAHVGQTEGAKRAQLRAALLTLPPDFLRALRDEGAALQDRAAWSAFQGEARAYYAAHLEEAADLRGAAQWCGRSKKAGPGQPFPLPAAHFGALIEAHAAKLWAGQEGAQTEDARRFYRYAGACCSLRAALARVLLTGGTA